MHKALQLIGLLALVVAVAGCGREPHRVPDVTGERLDVAQERLEAAGLAYETIGAASSA
jgi:beta-lactam-binding protein with PASTA domain